MNLTNQQRFNPQMGLGQQYKTGALQIQSRPWFRFSVKPDQTAEKQTDVADFMNNCKYQPIENAYKFKLSEQYTLWLPKKPFFSVGILMDPSKQGEWDLSIITEVFGREDCSMKAIQYCYTGFIKVHEERELTIFLLTCFLLQIGQPFSLLEKEQQFLRERNLVLQDPSELLDIDIFFKKCQSSQKYSQLMNPSISANTKTPFQSILSYSSILLAQNPYYYMVPNSNNQFNQKLKQLSEQTFTENFLGYFGSQLFVLSDSCRFISFDHVRLFYNAIQFYFMTSDVPQKDAKEKVNQTFSKYYNNISAMLTEEDQISCLEFLPGNASNTIDMLRQKTMELNQMRLRERAYINVLIAQKAQNISLDAYQNQFRQSIQIMTGQDIPQEIDNLIANEIQFAKQQGRY